MGIKVEFNPDLALRNISEYKNGNRTLEECIPENLEVGKTYNFIKKDQRLYWLDGEIPLLETKGDAELSKPKASIIILEATHYRQNNENFTRGTYQIIEVFTDNQVHFESYKKI